MSWYYFPKHTYEQILYSLSLKRSSLATLSFDGHLLLNSSCWLFCLDTHKTIGQLVPCRGIQDVHIKWHFRNKVKKYDDKEISKCPSKKEAAARTLAGRWWNSEGREGKAIMPPYFLPFVSHWVLWEEHVESVN